MKHCDLLVIGSGPAGHTAALEAAKRGLSVTLFERDLSRLGGTCLNEGCIPLKGFLQHCRSQKDFGALRDSVMERVAILRKGLLSRLKSSDVTVIEGSAAFESADTLRCGGESFGAKNIIIAGGSKARQSYNHSIVKNGSFIFEMESIPQSCLVIGGGAVGCEYAAFLAAMGARVDIAEAASTVLRDFEDETRRTLLREFKKAGIGVFTNAHINISGDSGRVTVTSENSAFEKTYTLILDATGRIADTAALGLAQARIQTDYKGFIAVDRDFRTSARNVFACGDAIATPMLAYAASAEAWHIVATISGVSSTAPDYSIFPHIVFSHPQIARVGFTTKNDAAPGDDGIVTKKYFFKALGGGAIGDTDNGFIKLYINKTDRTIRGAALVGNNVCDLVNELSLIISLGLNEEQICTAVYVHPSLSEIIVEAIRNGV